MPPRWLSVIAVMIMAHPCHGWLDWTIKTTELLRRSVLQDDIFELIEGAYVDLYIAYGTDVPRIYSTAQTCSWQWTKKETTPPMSRYDKGNLIGYSMNHWYKGLRAGKEIVEEDRWMLMSRKSDGTIRQTARNRFGVMIKNTMYPLYKEQKELLIAYVIRNRNTIKALGRLTKSWKTYVSVHYSKVQKGLQQATVEAVDRAVRHLKGLGDPIITLNGRLIKDFCYDNRYFV